MKHTPGPFSIAKMLNYDHDYQIFIVTIDQIIVARLDVWKSEAIPEMEANARLFEKAPEMLHAIEIAEQTLRNLACGELQGDDKQIAFNASTNLQKIIAEVQNE
jgi:hypothetical protein